MTKLAILSDIHVEFEAFNPDILLEGHPDVIILAGDIGTGTSGVAFAKTLDPVPVIYVPGNHEYYRYHFARNLQAMHDLARESNVNVLDNRGVFVDGVRFLGTTLWTDYAIHGNATHALANARLADQQLISYGDTNQLFTTLDALEEHKVAKVFLDTEMVNPHEGSTVVVTHHAPHPNSIAPQYRGTNDRLTPAFVSDLSDILEAHPIDLWVHGHDHNDHDYEVFGTRVVSAQKGYPGEKPWKVLNIEI